MKIYITAMIIYITKKCPHITIKRNIIIMIPKNEINLYEKFFQENKVLLDKNVVDCVCLVVDIKYEFFNEQFSLKLLYCLKLVFL